VLERCPSIHNDSSCDRVTVSSGFYRSPEFSGRGYFIYRLYDAALGRRPHYNEFVSDLAAFGLPADEAALAEAKRQFASAFLQRAEFASRYGGLTSAASAEAFVSRLEQSAGVRLANRAQLVAAMQSGAATAGETLRAFVESQEVEGRFFYRGFVAMQYFGYLRRDPEEGGFNAWVNILTSGAPGVAPGDYRTLIYGFVHSQEYRGRFGQP